MQLVPSSRHHYSLRFPPAALNCFIVSSPLINLSIPYFPHFRTITRPLALQPREKEEKERFKRDLARKQSAASLSSFGLEPSADDTKRATAQRQHRLFSHLFLNTGYSIHATLRAALISRCSTYTKTHTPPYFPSSSSHTPHSSTLRLLVLVFLSILFRLAPPLLCSSLSNQSPNVLALPFRFRHIFVPRAL